MGFELFSPFKPSGDQPDAIDKLTNGIIHGCKHQVLLGVTGSGKTFTIANVIAKVGLPTLVISHNKTLAAQLTQEYKEFFPKNAVEYFVSYYDYYQPEAYIPARDQYIEKEADINQEIDRLRLSATASLLNRNDVIVVASVSCIYNLGSPDEYGKSILSLDTNSQSLTREQTIKKLVDLFYNRNDFDFSRSTFRVRGENVDIWPAYETNALRLVFDERGYIRSINRISPLTGNIIDSVDKVVIYPAKHYVSDRSVYKKAFSEIRKDLERRIFDLKKQGKELEAHRIKQRTEYDLETIKSLGYCNGIENYSRYFDGRSPGETPFTLLDYFEKKGDWLLIVDESHITIPQIRGMYSGDRARKQTLIDYGFRLPSSADNRPLRFEEFQRKAHQTIYTSATPDEWEISQAGGNVIEQLIRPTGLVDPKIEIRRTSGQVGDLMKEITQRSLKKQRVLVTTLTKRMAEELSDYFRERGVKVTYLHSDVATLERTDILESLRKGDYDVVVGINLLREGLDLPEVSLVAILDADKEGFLRSRTSLIQTMGRASRHINGGVILYADRITISMETAVAEVRRRRDYQINFNKLHKIIPKSVVKSIREKLISKEHKEDKQVPFTVEGLLALSPKDQQRAVSDLEVSMKEAAEYLDFELAAKYRDIIRKLKRLR
jgi:excinuclease ABC subunit B